MVSSALNRYYCFYLLFMLLISALNNGKHFVGKFYLVDSGFVNDVGFLVPFLSITYHLKEFKRRMGDQVEGKKYLIIPTPH